MGYARPSAPVPAVPAANADPVASDRFGTTFTSCTHKLVRGISCGASKSYELLTSPTGTRIATLAGLFGLCVWGKAYGEEHRANLNCKGTDWCTTVECCVGTIIALGSTGSLLALGVGTGLGVLLKPWYDGVKNQPRNVVAAPIRALEERVNRISETVVNRIPAAYRPFSGRARNVRATSALFRGAALATFGGPLGAGIALGAALTPTHAASAGKKFSPSSLVIPEDDKSPRIDTEQLSPAVEPNQVDSPR